jgi:hypothetical protein
MKRTENRVITQKFDCENCDYHGTEVYWDDDFGGGLCFNCIATKAEWLIVEPKKTTRFQQRIAKRNAEITKLFVLGLSREFICEQYGMKDRAVRAVIRNAGLKTH